MSKKSLIVGVFFITLISTLSIAADLRFIEGGTDTLWSNPENWGEFTPPDGVPVGPVIPTSADFVSVNGSGSDGRGADTVDVLVDAGTNAVCQKMYIGDYDWSRPISVTVDGGTLTVGAGDGFWGLAVGYGGNTTGTLNVSSGQLNAEGNLMVGGFGGGTMNVTGGEVNVASVLSIAQGSVESHLYLSGGIINVTGGLSIQANGYIDISGGILYIASDATGTVETYASEGKITAGGGNSDLYIMYDSVEDVTIVREFQAADALIASWDFEDVSGSTVPDISGVLPEATGTLSGNAVVIGERRGNVLSLDGNSSYVDCGNAGKLVNPTAMTVAVWVKIADPNDSNWQCIVSKGNVSWRIYRVGSEILFAATDVGVGGWDNTHVIGGNIGDGFWHHIAGVYDGTALNLYVDANLVASKDVSSGTGTIWVTDDPVYIGGNSSETTSYFNGMIDDVEIFTAGLSEADIKERYSAGSEPVGKWDFEDGVTASVAADSSGIDPYADGTLNGNAAIVEDLTRGLVLSCDGDSDYVDCGNTSKLTNSGEMTIAAWIKVNDSLETNFQTVVSKGTLSWRICRVGDVALFAATDVGGNWDDNHITGGSMNDGLWHHIIGVYDGEGMYLYVDNTLVANKDVSGYGGSINLTEDPVYIGGNSAESNTFFNGLIDDVEIYNYALTASDIESRYIPATCQNSPVGDLSGDCIVNSDDLYLFSQDWLNPNIEPLAWFEFEAAGTVAVDSSGNGFDGTIIGAARVAGKYGNALDFDTDDGGDYVLVPNVLTGITDQITITMWQNGDADKQPQVDYVFDSYPQEYCLRGHIPHGDGVVYWDAGGEDFVAIDRISKTADPNDYSGKWNHWAFTKNVTTGDMKIYLNGSLWHSASGKTLPISVESLTIGSRNDPDGLGYIYNYDGMIDDFRVYDVELTEGEIANVMLERLTSAANLYYDDNVNYLDLAVIADNWLTQNPLE